MKAEMTDPMPAERLRNGLRHAWLRFFVVAFLIPGMLTQGSPRADAQSALPASGSATGTATAPADPPVRLTLDITWDVPQDPAQLAKFEGQGSSTRTNAGGTGTVTVADANVKSATKPSPNAPAGTGNPGNTNTNANTNLNAIKNNNAPATAQTQPLSWDIGITSGTILEVLPWPRAEDRGATPSTQAQALQGANGYSVTPARSGRIRTRLEAPVSAQLLLRYRDMTWPVPLVSLLDGPQRGPQQFPMNIVVERIPWDPIEITLGQGADGNGAIPPKAEVPVFVGLNPITPEPQNLLARVSLDLTALDNDAILEHREHLQSLVSNTSMAQRSRVQFLIPAPAAEGTYRLRVSVRWEFPPSNEGIRLTRWLSSRRRAAFFNQPTERHLAFVVIEPAALAGQPPKTSPAASPTPNAPNTTKADNPATRTNANAAGTGAGVSGPLTRDRVDWTQNRGGRSWQVGQQPFSPDRTDEWVIPENLLTMFETRRGDLIRDFFNFRTANGPPKLPAVTSETASFLTGMLHVEHPGRPHRLSLTIRGGHPNALAVGLLALGNGNGNGNGVSPTRSRVRILLDAGASGPPVLEQGPPLTFSWLVWPDTPSPVMVVVNRGSTPVEFQSVELAELANTPAGPTLNDRASDRQLGIHLENLGDLERFGGGRDKGPEDWLARARNLADFLEYCGATMVILPDELLGPSRTPPEAGVMAPGLLGVKPRSLDGQAEEWDWGLDRLQLLLNVLNRRGFAAWVELRGDRIAAKGVAPRPVPPGMSPMRPHPLMPEVRQAWTKRVAEAVAVRPGAGPQSPRVQGVLIRFDSEATLPGEEVGLDDAIYGRFVSSAFAPETAATVPGLGLNDALRFEERRKFLQGRGKIPWRSWQAQQIHDFYQELARVVEENHPRGVLALITPGGDPRLLTSSMFLVSPTAARRLDWEGEPASEAWKGVGLDLNLWARERTPSPIIFRGVTLDNDPILRDLATSSELDSQLIPLAKRGFLISGNPANKSNSDRISGPALRAPMSPNLPMMTAQDDAVGDGLLSHALAELDAGWVAISSTALAGHEDRFRAFAQMARILPQAEGPFLPALGQETGVAARAISTPTQTYYAIMNDTPYPVVHESWLSAPPQTAVDDLKRGLRLAPETADGKIRLVIALAPHDVVVIRLGTPNARAVTVKTHHHQVVKSHLKVQAEVLAARLEQLRRHWGVDELGAGVEQPVGAIALDQDANANANANATEGWHVLTRSPEGVVRQEPGRIATDQGRPRAGGGDPGHSLRLDAAIVPVSAVSARVAPPEGRVLIFRGWVRADRPDTLVRVWLEGEVKNHPVVRWSESRVGQEWIEIGLDSRDLHEPGLEKLRVRLELLTPGRLWVDDVVLFAAPFTEPELRHTCRALINALQAYRDGHLSLFARLADSHWVRQAEQVSQATDLPGRRRLR